MNNASLDSNEPYVVVIGGANIDVCGRPANALNMHDSNIGNVITSPGGVARNIAENLVRLGVRTKLLSVVGADQFGEILLTQANAAGIDVSDMVRLEGQKTSTYLSVLDGTADLLVAINDMEIVDKLDAEFLQHRRKIIKQAAIVIADTNLSESALAYLVKSGAANPLIVDAVSITKAVRIKPHLGYVHTLKANLLEAEVLCGIKPSACGTYLEMAQWFHDAGVKRIFITLGPQGVFYSDAYDHGIVESRLKNPVINASGAGDAFVAAVAFAWFNEQEIKATAEFAISAANVALSHSATVNPDMSVSTVNEMRSNEYGE